PIRIGPTALSGIFTSVGNSDTTPPTLNTATAACFDNAITLTFSEPVESATAANPLNYQLSGGLQIMSSQIIDAQTVWLFVDQPIQPAFSYVLGVGGVRDK